MSLLGELKRRRVFGVAVLYAGGAWAVARVAGAVDRASELPEWVVPFVLFVVILGFPVAMVLAWARDLESGSAVRTAHRSTIGVGAKLAYLSLLVAGTGLLAWMLTGRWASPPMPFQPHPHSVEAARPLPEPD